MPDLEKKLNRLLMAVQDLSMARTLNEVTTIVRTAARELTGADGATFVLRDGDLCYYADEDAISPLWKGKRFPMGACISGWVMLNQQQVIIPDIYQDPRVPTDAYKPTFVKSLAMVPIRQKNPIGAIGNYWSKEYEADPSQMRLLQALADSTSVTLENIQLYRDLEVKVKERTAELESFSYTVSHDLKAPLRGINGFAKILHEDYSGSQDATFDSHIKRIQNAATKMSDLIDSLLELSKFTRGEIKKRNVNLTQLVTQISSDLKQENPSRNVEFIIQNDVTAVADLTMLRAALENLIRNAWKFSRNNNQARIEFKSEMGPNGNVICCIKDNGVGFDSAFADILFRAFQRLHNPSEFEGTGIGLATVQRIISRHGGKVWARSEPGQGAQFYFDLPKDVQI